MKGLKGFRLFIIFLLLIVFLYSCTVPIAQIKKSPSNFANKKIKIKGVVIKVIPVPLTSVKVVEVYDNTDTLFVLTKKVVKKNEQKTFEGEIIVIGGKMTKERFEILIKKISRFLIENELATQKDVKNYSKKIIGFLGKIFKEKNAVVFMIEY